MEKERQVPMKDQSLMPFALRVLIVDAARKWMLILVVAVIFGMGAYIYADTGYVPSYRTSATLVLTTRDSASSIRTNLDAAADLAGVFTEILNSSVMRNTILKELDMTAFSGTILASAIPETNLLTIDVTAGDPGTAFRVLQVLLDSHGMVTYEVMGDIVLEVLEYPVVPTGPENAADAGQAMVLATAGAGGAIFVLLVVLAYFKDVVRSREEAEQKLNCWCLGELPHERKRHTFRSHKKKHILITDPETSFRYVANLNKLRRRVGQHMQKGKVLMVTSVLENEGKSTICANLAIAMARKKEKVLLIDLDFQRPACRRIMDSPSPEYWTDDVICGRVSLSEAVSTDKRSRMDILAARQVSHRDLTHSEGIRLLLEQARKHYHKVLIDLPPMNAASDTELVMEYADASLLVIRQNWARTVDLNRAIGNLQRGKAEFLGCVLNNVHASGSGYGTGYYRYGRYARYAAEHDAVK